MADNPAFVEEPARRAPVIHEADLCVLGGSCTGLFAAVRAARLGARVCLVEQHGRLGGVATLSLVNIWHSLFDTTYDRRIIAGLTGEVIDRLDRRGAVGHASRNPGCGVHFNSAELTIELDELAREHRLKVYLHTMFCTPVIDGDRVSAVIVENKSGRGAIRARCFIDATGDADLCARLPDPPTYHPDHVQPATTCAHFTGWPHRLDGDLSPIEAIGRYGSDFGLPPGFAWGAAVPNAGIHLLAGTRVSHLDATDADSLTDAEIEGRRQVRAIADLLRAHGAADLRLVGLPARIGLRESRHVRCRHRLSADDVLSGRRFDDAIANGSYRVDVHHQDKPGITFHYLNGVEEYCVPGAPKQTGRWRDPIPQDPTFYQAPLRALMPQGNIGNLLVAGRMIDADPQAHGALRVMVNTNQTGEAAGVAAWHALDRDCPVAEVAPQQVRNTLAAGGSIII